jgi:hypothetical protein
LLENVSEGMIIFLFIWSNKLSVLFVIFFLKKRFFLDDDLLFKNCLY